MFARHRGHTFVAPPTDNAIDISIAENTFDFNLLARIGAALTTVTTVTIRVGVGVIVAARSTGAPAFDLRNVMFAGSTLRIINQGYILGLGGDGGDGASINGDGVAWYGHAGRAGGNAIIGPGAGITFELTNGSGRIWGGGGGGGGGGATSSFGADRMGRGGGGGGGAGGGKGGKAGENTNENEFASPNPAGDGTSASTGIDGTFGTGGTASQRNSADGGNGGNGGDWGAAGADGEATSTFALSVVRTTGGAAGKAIELNGGTATFLNGGGAPNVKGAVS